MEYWISPTGERVAYTIPSGVVVTPEITWVYDIGVADLKTGATRIITRRVPNFWGPAISWSPDGLHIAFTTKPHSYSRIFPIDVGESHAPMLYSRANVTDYLNRLVRWFGIYLSDSSSHAASDSLR